MYLTHEEYMDLGGTVQEPQYRLLEAHARAWIDELTWNRVRRMAEVPEAVKMAMMHLLLFMERYGPMAMANSPLVASFNTDGYSESYGSADAQWSTSRNAVEQAVIGLLNGVDDDYGVPLLFTGVAGTYPLYGWNDPPEEEP